MRRPAQPGMSGSDPTRITRPQWCGFLALCLLSASSWLVDGAWPGLLPAAERQALHDGLIALAVGGVGWKSLAWPTLRTRPWTKLALASVGLLGLPAALLQAAAAGVSEVTAAALFALLPLVVVLLVANSDFGRTGDGATSRLLVPALAGLAGTLLLLSFALPQSPRQVWLQSVVVCAVVVAAFASVWMYRFLAEFSLGEAVVIACLANGLFACASSLVANFAARDAAQTWIQPGSAFGIEAAIAVLFDLPQIVLLLWLMRAVPPARLAARTLVIPLLTVLEGYALLRPALSLRSLCGAALIAVGAWRLLTAGPREEEPTLMLHG